MARPAWLSFTRFLKRITTSRTIRRDYQQHVALQVEQLEDRWVPNTYTVTTADDLLPGFTIRTGVGTFNCTNLREAIKEVNKGVSEVPGINVIKFNIPGNAIPTIFVRTAALPIITSPVYIDGTSQGIGLVRIDGAKVPAPVGGGAVNGLVIQGGKTIVDGLIITGFTGSGIQIDGSKNGDTNWIRQNNYIGTDLLGTAGLGNGTGIEIVGSVNNWIGGYVNLDAAGVTTDVRNVISGNLNYGIRIRDYVVTKANRITRRASTDNEIMGNIIGLNPAGTAKLPNNVGVSLLDNSYHNTIGGSRLYRNIISGNTLAGIEMVGGIPPIEPDAKPADKVVSNIVSNNYVGTDKTGAIAIGNGVGISLEYQAISNRIGAEQTPDADGIIGEPANIISGNKGAGILISGPGAEKNLIIGNFVGLDVSGSKPLPNKVGIRLEATKVNQIGLVRDGQVVEGGRNIISGNTDVGIELVEASDNIIAGNFVGTDKAGLIKVGSQSIGMYIRDDSNSNTMGAKALTNANGFIARPVNLISANENYNILIQKSASNKVFGNFIGTDVSGNQAAVFGQFGVGAITGVGIVDSVRTQIGSLSQGFGNVISGNRSYGIRIAAIDPEEWTIDNVIEGNFIGTNKSGSAGLSNAADSFVQDIGVLIEGGALLNTVGRQVAVQDGVIQRPANVISGNASVGVEIDGPGATFNRVLGNFIGISFSGLAPISISGQAGVQKVGVFVSGSSFNTIGGPTTESGSERNVVAGNFDYGISIVGLGASQNDVLGNYIGTDKTGNQPLVDQNAKRFQTAGIQLAGRANKNTVKSGNVISGNAGDGIFITRNLSNDREASNNLIFGNLIGTNRDGSSAIGNGANGIFVDWCPSNVIGGSGDDQRNIISGNVLSGIRLLGTTASENKIQNNYIGTNKVGDAAIPNKLNGVSIENGASKNLVGGGVQKEGNVISGNGVDAGEKGGNGIYIFASDKNLVQGNFIGTDFTGRVDVGNRGSGVYIDLGSENLIGGPQLNLGNVIAANDKFAAIGVGNKNKSQNNWEGKGTFGEVLPNKKGGIVFNGNSNLSTGDVVVYNLGAGITISGTGNSVLLDTIFGNLDQGVVVVAGTQTLISRSSISYNGGIGIDLVGGSEDGFLVTADDNDDLDTDTGANDLQNYPEFSSATREGGFIHLVGELHSTPNISFTVEFFGDAGDPSGHGEGEIYLGTLVITTDADGLGEIDTSFAEGDVQGLGFITATATDADNNTSEFSGLVAIQYGSTTELTTSDNPLVYGASFSLSVSVSSIGSSPYTPTGDVTIYDTFNGTTSVLVVDHLGEQGPALPDLDVGMHILTVVYSGDVNFHGSTSEAYFQVVVATDTTTELDAANGQGTAFTLDALVSDVAPGGGAPTGVVDVYDTFSGSTIFYATMVLGLQNQTFPALEPGSHHLQGYYRGDGNHNPSVSDSVTLVIPGTPSGNPSPGLSMADANFDASGAATVGTDTPNFTGTAPSGTTVDLMEGSTVLGTATADSNGLWSLTSASLSDGAHTLRVRVTISTNNYQYSNDLTVTVDTTTTASAPALAATSDRGISSSDALTNVATPRFQGTADPGATVQLKEGSTVLGTTKADVHGNWSITSSTLADGTHTVFVHTTDPTGNNTDSDTMDVTIETTIPDVSAPDLAAGSDSGSSSTDNLTNDDTPTFTGTAEAGSTVQLREGNRLLGTTIADSNGDWSITSKPLANGVHTILVRATDEYGNTHDASTLSITIDTKTSVSPPNLSTASDTGSSSSDDNTSTTAPTFTGTAEAGSTVALREGSTVLGTATADAYGAWSITSSTLGDGVHEIYARVTDAAGNTQDSNALTVTIDTTAPEASDADLDSFSDSGSDDADDLTNETTPTFTGTAEAGSTVQLREGSTVLGTATVDVGGNWEIVSDTLSSGAHTIYARTIDAAGNYADGATLTVTIDTAVPSVSAPDLDADSDSGSSSTDNLTNAFTPVFTGTAEAGSTVALLEDDTVLGTATADSNGEWSITGGFWEDGDHVVYVRATDAAGNTHDSSTLTVTIDTTTPNVSDPDLAAASDSGDSATDDLTSDATPTFTGTAETGSTVELWDESTLLGTTTADSNGDWTITSSSLDDGAYAITVWATDAAGNYQGSSTLLVTIDTTAPAVAAPDLTAASDSGASTTDDLTSVTTPTFTGTAEAGSAVELREGSTVLGNATADEDGHWSITSDALSNDNHIVYVRATDLAGNHQDSATLTVTVDTLAPAALTPDLAAASDSGSSSTDNLTSVTTPTFTGTAAAGVTVELRQGSSLLGSTTVGSDGSWSITSSTLATGTYAIFVRVPDGGSGTVDSTTLSVTVDTLAPAALTPDLVSSSDTGSSNSDNVTNDTTPTFTGTAAAGTTVELRQGSTLLGSTTAGSDGSWSITSSTLANGTYAVFVRVPDGSSGTVGSTTLSVTIDASAPSVSAPDLDTDSDSGSSSTDNLTNSIMPLFTGTAEAGTTVELREGSTVLGSVTADVSGDWSLQSIILADGTHAVYARAIDGAGNYQDSSVLNVTIDSAPPGVSGPDLIAASDSGGSTSDDLTSVTTPTFVGTAEPDSLVELWEGWTLLGSTTADGNGDWSITTDALSNGVHAISAWATDEAGNFEGSGSLMVTIDTLAPAALTPDLAAGSDSGSSSSDNVTSDTTPTFSGTAAAGVTIELRAGSNLLGSTTSGSDGSWTITSSTLADGTYEVFVRVPDGVSGTVDSTTLSVTIDTAIAVSSPDLVAGSDSGSSTTDNLTSDNTPTFTGTAEAGTTVELREGSTVLGSATADSSGDWSITSNSLSSETHAIYARATDLGGNSQDSSTLTVTIDTTAPSVSVPDLTADSDSGSSNSDNKTNDNTPTLSGTAEAGAVVQLWQGSNLLGNSTADSNGVWSITSSLLTDGSYSIFARATDAAGNSHDTSALTVTIDTAAPSVSVPDLASSSDSGSSSTDDLTNVLTPTFTGTAEPGSTVQLREQLTGSSTLLGSTTADASGDWSITSIALADGDHVVFTRATDAAGNTLDSDTLTVSIAAAATTTGLSASATPTTYGQSVTFTATISTVDANNGTPTGQVTFTIDGTPQAPSTLTNGQAIFITSTLSAGSHTISVSYAGTAAYQSSSSSNLSQTVNTASLTVTAGNASKTYGDSVSFDGTEFTTSGLVNGDSIASVSLSSSGTSSSAGVNTYTITPSSASGSSFNASNYSITYTNGTLTVNAKALTITANSTSKTYGATVTFAGSEFSASGLVNSETIGAVSLYSGGAAASAGASATPYTITVGSATGGSFTAANYSITYVDGSLTVNKAHLTVTADNVSRLYGASDPTFTATITGFVNGENLATSGVTGSPSLTPDGEDVATSPAGSTYPISVGVGTLAASNYDFTTFTDGTLTVNKAHLTVTADDASRLYGASDPTFTATITGFVNGQNLGTSGVTGAASLATAATATSGVGGYDITASAGTLAAGNYDFTYVAGTLTINKAHLTVTANNASRLYGAADPTFSITLTGFVNGETSAVVSGTASFTTAGTDTATAAAGSTHAITPSQGTLAASNYDFTTFTAGTMTVNVKPLTITANNASKPYGQTLTFAGTEFTVSGLANSETIGSVSLSSSGAVDTAGVNTYTISVSSATGGSFTASNYSITYTSGTLTVTPVVSTPDLISTDDHGSSNTDNITNVAAPTFTGTATPGIAVALFQGSISLGSTTADGSGNWSIPSGGLADGQYNYFARATSAGISQDSATLSVTIDTQTPFAPSAPDLASGSDTGTSSTDNLTRLTTPTFTGTAEANSTVKLYESTTLLGTATADGSGNWSITSSTLATGSHAVYARTTDVAGNTSSDSSTLSVTIDTTAPSASSTPDMISGSDSGSSQTDNITNYPNVTFMGSAEANSTVKLFENGTQLSSTTADGSGSWISYSVVLAPGTHVIYAQVTDAAGNTSSNSATLTVTVDNTISVSVPDLTDASDTGASNTDNLTDDDTPTFSGTADANSTVQLYEITGGSPNLLGSTTADGSGNWTITTGTLNGTHVVFARATDVAGNSMDTSTLAVNDAPTATTGALLEEIRTGVGGSSPSNFVNVNGTVFFQANNATDGFELWKSDGTAAGTVLVKNIRSGASASLPANLTNVNGTLFFQANDGSNGLELWKSDGTSAGTTIVKDINPGAGGSNPVQLTNVNGTLFFTAGDGTHGRELWQSDGTSTGTTMVKDVRPGATTSYLDYLTNVNGTLFFSASDGSHGYELWQSDGTSSGTTLVKDISTGSARPINLTNVNGTLFFSANEGSSHGFELWKSDGTSTGTSMVKEIRAGASGSLPAYLTNVNGTLFFQANEGTYGFELWKSDGTSTGTTLVKDIRSGVGISDPQQLTNVNGTLFFSANDGTNGFELWKSDGTSSGTVLVKNIRSGAGASSPANLTNVSGTLFFTANDGTTGIELWQSDGTSGGTTQVGDIRSGASNSLPSYLTNVNGILFFQANDGSHGEELWLARPLTCSTPDLTIGSDTGSSGTDNITSDTTPTLSGTATAGATVNVYNKLTYLGSTTADSSGNWSFTTSTLSLGVCNFWAAALDDVGNVQYSGTLTVTLTNSPP